MPVLYLFVTALCPLKIGFWSLDFNAKTWTSDWSWFSLPCPPDVWVEVCGSNRLRVGLEAVEEFWQQRIRSLFCRFVPLTRQLGDGMSFGQVSESLWYEPGGTVAVSQQRIGSAHRLWKTRAFINAEKSFDHIFISAICLLLFISKLTFGRINTELQQKWAERGGKSDLKRDTSC